MKLSVLLTNYNPTRDFEYYIHTKFVTCLSIGRIGVAAVGLLHAVARKALLPSCFSSPRRWTFTSWFQTLKRSFLSQNSSVITAVNLEKIRLQNIVLTSFRRTDGQTDKQGRESGFITWGIISCIKQVENTRSTKQWGIGWSWSWRLLRLISDNLISFVLLIFREFFL